LRYAAGTKRLPSLPVAVASKIKGAVTCLGIVHQRCAAGNGADSFTIAACFGPAEKRFQFVIIVGIIEDVPAMLVLDLALVAAIVKAT
jgi:hypothetical protein